MREIEKGMSPKERLPTVGCARSDEHRAMCERRLPILGGPPANQRSTPNRDSYSSASSGVFEVRGSLSSKATSPTPPGTSQVSPTLPPISGSPAPEDGPSVRDRYDESLTLAPILGDPNGHRNLFGSGTRGHVCEPQGIYREITPRITRGCSPTSAQHRARGGSRGPMTQKPTTAMIPTRSGPPPLQPAPSAVSPRHAPSSGQLNHPQSAGGHRPPRRRGNLPKWVTERLRAWFTEHITHPYPTDEEKNRLMRETSLTLNQACCFRLCSPGFSLTETQVSNWFINARRRKLPRLNREAEAEATLRTQLAGPAALGYPSA